MLQCQTRNNESDSDVARASESSTLFVLGFKARDAVTMECAGRAGPEVLHSAICRIRIGERHECSNIPGAAIVYELREDVTSSRRESPTRPGRFTET